MATFQISGVSDLMFSRYVAERKKDNETHDQHEERTWRNKVSVLSNGQVYLQPFFMKNTLEFAAQWLGLKIPGERGKMYKDRFVKGLLVQDNMLLEKKSGKSVTMDDIEPVRLFVPSDGKRGSSKRVFRIFPVCHEWNCVARVMVFDNKITPEVFEKHCVAAGQFIGFGAMRVGNGGINGRFAVSDFRYEALAEQGVA